MSFFENTRKPTGFGGKVMVNMMNLFHAPLADWGMKFLPLSSNAKVLDCGYSFISSLAESNKLAEKSLAALERKLQSRDLHPLFLTGHTGWTDNFEFAFAHKDKLCSPFKKRVPDPTAPYDAYDESDDTEEVARAGYLQAVGR